MDLALFFRMGGSHNGIKALRRSLLFDRFAEGNPPDVQFEVDSR
jgi:hypothetical protein